jgi:hypothetical protein
MRRTLAALITTLMALAIVATPAAAHTDAAPVAPDLDVTELTLYAIEDTFTVITADGTVLTDEEAADRPPSLGDRFVSIDNVYSDEERTELIGRNHFGCEVTEAEGELPDEEDIVPGEELPFFRVSTLCSGALDLFGQGVVSWDGLATFSSEDLEELIELGEDALLDEPIIVVAITGGTFEFIGASGEVAIFGEESPVEDEFWFRYEVTLL